MTKTEALVISVMALSMFCFILAVTDMCRCCCYVSAIPVTPVIPVFLEIPEIPLELNFDTQDNETKENFAIVIHPGTETENSIAKRINT